MQFMIDTDISSYVIRRRPPELLQRFSEVADQLCISVVTEAELRFGALRRASSSITEAVEQFFDRLPVLPWTRAAAKHYAAIRTDLQTAGSTIGNMDLLIAAHARAERLTLVTDNERHFSRVSDLVLRNWIRT